MSEISLEKIDVIRERTGVSYTEAKEALEICNGNVVDALVYIENNSNKEDMYTTKDEFLDWIKNLIKEGQVNRIKIRKDDKVIVDIPVNAGVAAGVLSLLIWWPLVVAGVVTAVFTKVTIEITKSDGSVEVVNKIIKTTADEVKEKMKDAGTDIKEAVKDASGDIKEKFNKRNKEGNKEYENVYKYTVDFDEENDDKNE
ncbi:DUF4342 domain-containing protein [Haloimpatiens sp. FM7330]|uniref:DUF4342 domain-containing protein n=1 Tax=Haloimpatiens sp. FM7330 TaxID=3298610 RepID=UPI00363793A1